MPGKSRLDASDYATDIDGDGCRDADKTRTMMETVHQMKATFSRWIQWNGDTDFGVGGSQDNDDDSDGWSDSMEVDCGGTDIIDPASFMDTDGDGECNYLDEDDDGDDVLDILDAFPLKSVRV